MLYFKRRLERNIFSTTTNSLLVQKIVFKLKPVRERRFHIFCVGLPRSGTHSIANIFRNNYRADHEPLNVSTIKMLLKVYNKELSRDDITKFLKIRDRFMQLELESAHYLHKIIPDLVRVHKNAKFILTVRDPISWLESEINANLNSKPGGIWEKLEDMRYGRKVPKLVKSGNLKYDLSDYLNYYSYHIKQIFDNVPTNKLLIINTFDIANETTKISEFLGINSKTLKMKYSHSAKRKIKKIAIEDIVDMAKLISDVEKKCGKTIREKIPIVLKNAEYLQ